MSDRRERERRAAAAASARTNEYFVPKDGIDREVITADICRYLGNDALVRPGNYENPQTRQIQQGYFITAYRNLTTAMIADLKADSERWEAERRQTAIRGQPSNVEYRASTTHQSRQYYGPTEATQGTGMTTPGYPSASAGSGAQQGVYDQYNSSGSYAQPATSTYNSTPAGYTPDYTYVSGAPFSVQPDMDSSRGGRTSAPSSGTVPRTGQYPAASSTYPPQRGDPQSGYYPQQGQPTSVPSSSYQSSANPTDPYYGRGTYGDPQDVYDNRGYADNGASYSSQPQMAQSTPATSGSSRPRERDRDDRDRRSHRHR